MIVETIGDATLYLGDCLEILPTLGKVDAVVTDPPYGVNLGVKVNNKRFDRDQYTRFEDTEEYVKTVCVGVIQQCIGMSGVCVVTPGIKRMFAYPEPTHVGSFYYPAASGCNSWGFSNWQPIFFYGKDPYGGKGSKHDSKQFTGPAEKFDHPCVKPLNQITWLVDRATLHNTTILDPFMGSGTTGVACMNLGRKFIGIEIEPKYFDIACERIRQAQSQGRLFA